MTNSRMYQKIEDGTRIYVMNITYDVEKGERIVIYHFIDESPVTMLFTMPFSDFEGKFIPN